jgi:hypothetical protein
MPKWETTPKSFAGFNAGGDSFQPEGRSTGRPLKAAFEPKGDTVFDTPLGYIGCGIVEGSRAYLLDMVPSGYPVSPRFSACADPDYGLHRFRSLDGTMDLVVGIQKDSATWWLPARTREQYEWFKTLWHKLLSAL